MASQYIPKSSEVLPATVDDVKAGCSLPVLVTNRLYVSRGVETLRERENVEHDRQASTRDDTSRILSEGDSPLLGVSMTDL